MDSPNEYVGRIWHSEGYALVMEAVMIQARGISKRYRRRRQEQYAALRDVLTQSVRAPWTLFRGAGHDTFWSLKDVSLEVREGEVLGLIGRNGAGKTTLLKILSRITTPTAGWAEIRGRVGSLLEVGTGFHPELTGRENVFLSGAILGMRKREIEGKFEEIVAVAELEQFVDTPVKHYSSGMYVRLAFAVAAHLEPEILLVDEVLAVGDINFQKKCLSKMGDVARGGRTVVLVSHQLNQIRRLCHRVVWIDAGQARQNGNTHEVVSAYESAMRRTANDNAEQRRDSGAKSRFLSWRIVKPRDDNPHLLTQIGPTIVEFVVENRERLRHAVHGIALLNHDRQVIWGWAAYDFELEPGQHEFIYSFPMLPLRPGSYSWLVSLYEDDREVDSWDCLPEMVVATESHQHRYDHWSGILNMPSVFQVSTRNEKAPPENDLTSRLKDGS